MVYIKVVLLCLVSSVVCLITVLGDDLKSNSDSNYWQNFAKNFTQQAKSNLSSLNDLGAKISQEVHDHLRPVREMEFRARIKNGDRGTTLATFKDRRFIIRNAIMYECHGTISINGDSCTGTINKAMFNNKKDFCYANINTAINNWYCISNGPINFNYNNGKASCDSTDNSSTLLITKNEYRNLCGSEAYPVTYKYFTNAVGDHGSDVHCSENKPYYVCTLTENHDGEVIYSVGSYIRIQSFLFLTMIVHIGFLQTIFA